MWAFSACSYTLGNEKHLHVAGKCNTAPTEDLCCSEDMVREQLGGYPGAHQRVLDAYIWASELSP